MSDNPVPTSIAGRLAGNPTGRVVGQSVVALGLVALASLLTDMAAEVVDLPSKSIVFVPVVLGVAIFWGMVPALIATLGAVFAGSFFFYPPILSLHVDNPQELIDLVVFSCVAIACSQLADMARRAIRAAEDRTGPVRVGEPRGADVEGARFGGRGRPPRYAGPTVVSRHRNVPSDPGGPS